MTTDFYDKQKEVHGKWATFAWIGSGFYLFLTSENAPLVSWQALAFFLVGTFAAAIVFGVAAYAIQRVLGKLLMAVIKNPTAGAASMVRLIGVAMFVIETVVIFLVAQWVFRQIV